MKTDTQDVRLVLALFCLLTCLGWLTARAHIDIPDAETLFLVAESLVERGTFVQLEPELAADPARAVLRAPDGNLYAFTAPLQSLLSVPLYVVGRAVARFFPPPFLGTFTRFFVSLFNSPIHAATTGILYLFGLDLGYRRRTSLFVALTYSVATIAWPYSRTYFAETLFIFFLVLAAWAAQRSVGATTWHWAALMGAALGLGVATKYHTVIVGPAFVLYLFLELGRRTGWPARWRWIKRNILASAIPFLLIVVALMIFNYARFDSVFETGYTKGSPTDTVDRWTSQATPLASLYGYFFSAGKGFFFFSLPTVLGLAGWSALRRRRRNVAWLLLTAAAIYPLAYSLSIPNWHGGGNWGPRYIVCITPFLTLPIGAFLERQDLTNWWRVGAAATLFVAGFLVQLSTVLADYSTYLFGTTEFNHQLYYPTASPLAAQWHVWAQQSRAWRQYDHELWQSDRSFFLIDDSLYAVEAPEMAPFGRWMGERTQLRIYAPPDQPVTVRVAYSRPHLGEGEDWAGLRFIWDGAPRTGERRLITENDGEARWEETVTIPVSRARLFPTTVEITATTWIPQSGDPRQLSVFIEQIDVSSGATALPLKEAHLPRPMPVSTPRPWSFEAKLWFYDPFNARPFDVWPWYVWTSGIPLPQARAFITALTSLLGSGLMASTMWFIQSARQTLPPGQPRSHEPT